MTAESRIAPSPLTPEALLQLADFELSTRARVAHVALLMAALLMTVAVSSLWATEPHLPARTHVAFGVMTAIGLAWTAFAARVLATRRVLYAPHAVLAGRMAVAFTSVFVAGALVLALASGMVAGYAAAATGAALLAAAIVRLRRARASLARLAERRSVLERELGRRS